MGILEGAGELVSTANDLIRLLEALTGLRQTSLAAAFDIACEPLFSLGEDQMAYGFKVRRSPTGGVYYGKPGGVAGYSAMILWRRTPRIGIVLLANRGQFDKLNRLGVKLIESAVQ